MVSIHYHTSLQFSVCILVLGFGILYLLFLTFILFQSYKDVREIMFYLDPTLKGLGPDTEVNIVSFLVVFWYQFVSRKRMEDK